MKTVAVVALTALMGFGALAPSAAEARGGGALAADLIGGLAAGALLGAAVSEAHAAPAYAYGAPAYGYGGPAYGYDAPPPVAYRPTRYVRSYEVDVPVYRQRRYDAYDGYGYRARGWHRDCDRPYYGW